MSNVFLLYMPPGNAEAMAHYRDTIEQKVPLSRIAPHVSAELRAKLMSIFGLSPIAVWGSSAGRRNRVSFDRMSIGDDVLIVEGEHVKLIGKVAAKVESKALSHALWSSLRGSGDSTWELIYFIANAREVEISFADVRSLLGYAGDYRLRGFTPVASARLEEFYRKYDDLHSVLLRISDGRPVAQKLPEGVPPIEAPAAEGDELSSADIDEALRSPLISRHVTVQWQLARLGLKAGERVWVPTADQSKLRIAYQFESFDSEFSPGIDLPPSYVENIDVIWKKEFRIGAAYEIENTTSIYSGLLRFADLNIIAPNTLYPMFIVAPEERKTRLREQLRRPTFRRLELDKKVRFLSYESIDEIDRFFANSDRGLNVEVIIGKSEQVT